MKMKYGLTLIASLTALFAALAPTPASGAPSFTNLLDVDVVIDRYVELLARKYDLTEEQANYTHQFVSNKAHEVIDGDKDELFSLVDQMFAVRAGGEMTQEELIAWGQRVRPIYDKAKEVIIEANDEWRAILSDEQKKVHDADLTLMNRSFLMTEDQLTRIVNGQMTVEEFRKRPHVNPQLLDPQPPTDPVTPPTPPSTQPQQQPQTPRAEDKTPHTAPPVDANGFETAWDKYVKDFIAKYKLDEQQEQKALDMLKSCKEAALVKWKRIKPELERLDKQIDDAKKAKNQNKVKALSAKRDKTAAPISDIFERQLKPRLEKLPTAAQRKAAEEAEKKPAAAKSSAKRR